MPSNNQIPGQIPAGEDLDQGRLGAEKRYRTLFNAIDEGVCIIAMIFDEHNRPCDYRFVETNPAFEQQTGLVFAAGKRMRELAPGHEQHWFEIYGKIALTGEPLRFQHHANELGRWFDVYAFRIGEPARREVAVLFRDITRRTQDETGLHLRVADLKQAQAATRLGSWRWDRTTAEITWSEELYRIFGVDPATFTPTLAITSRLMPPEARGPASERVSPDLTRTPTAPFECLIPRPNGEERVVLASSVALATEAGGNPTVLFGTALDITELKRTEDNFRHQQELFRAVADNIPQLAWITAADGEILWFNRRWFEYTGLTLEQMKGEGWQSVHHPDHPHNVAAGWKRALETGEPWEDTFPLRRSDGEYRWFLSRAFPIRNSSGEIIRWFGTNTDVTELRETEDALKKADAELRRHTQSLETTVVERTAALRETVQELEEFSYSLSHDLRAPLRAMKGFAQILETNNAAQLDADGRVYLSRIASAAGRLDQLIQDVLAYSRVVREPIALEPVDTERLVRQLIDENPALYPANADIEVRTPLLPVLGHEAYLMQVISNLVFNAVKFVHPGQRPRVRIWTETVDSEVRLNVRDDGIGIPADAQQRLFAMFQRVHGHHVYEGTGMGLAIVRKAVERMDGTVGVESESGKGSLFWVRLRKASQ